MAQATGTEARRLTYGLTQTHTKQTNKKSKLTDQQIKKLKHIQKRQKISVILIQCVPRSTYNFYYV